MLKGAIAGLLWAAAFCFYPEWPLLRWFIGLAALTLLFSLWSGERERKSPGEVAAGSFVFGLCAFSVACHWIYHSVRIVNGGPVALAIALVFLLAALMGGWYALGGYWAARWGTDKPRLTLLVILPSVLVLCEWVRGWVFTGFPWLSTGYLTGGVFAGKWPSVFAPLGGMYLVGWITAVVAGASLLVLRMKANPVRRGVSLFVMLAVLVTVGQIPLASHPEESHTQLRARLVQGGIPQEEKWLEENFIPTLSRYENLSFLTNFDRPSDSETQLIIWPEIAVPATQQSVRKYLDDMDRFLRERNLTLALGILTESESEEGRFNSLIALGDGEGTYHKHHLVPFGEFFPVPDVIKDWLLSMRLPANQLARGPEDQAPIRAAGALIGVSICYEAAFGSEQRKWLPEAEVLINISNDGWFGDTVALEQHLDMARMRAMEARRYLLRVTGTGITAAIDPSGRIISRLPKYEAGFADVSVPRLHGATPYVRFGDWPAVVLCLVLGILLPWAVRIVRRGSAKVGEQE